MHLRWAAIAVSMALGACGCSGPAEDSGDLESATVEPGFDGPLGKADSAAGQVELKVMLPSEQIGSFKQKFGLRDGVAAKRDIWFYDTSSLELFDAGVILRGRDKSGEPDDSTVKLRPMDASEISPDWLALDGFKCEEDRSLFKSVSSCSFTVEQGEDELVDIAAGKRAIDKAFSSEQEDFLDAYSSVAVDWSELQPLGPVAARVWKVRPKTFDQKLTVELWELPDASRLLEVSMRATPELAEQRLAELAHYLESRGFDTSEQQDTKTRAALQVLAATSN